MTETCGTSFSVIIFFPFKQKKSTKTVLDYFFVPEWMASEIMYTEIYEKYEYDVSDHLPLFTEINMKKFLDDHSYNISRNANSDDIQNYRNTSENPLKTHSYHTESISKDTIDQHLQQITVSLLLASDKHIPCGKFRPFLKWPTLA